MGCRFRNLLSSHLAPSKLSPRPSISWWRKSFAERVWVDWFVFYRWMEHIRYSRIAHVYPRSTHTIPHMALSDWPMSHIIRRTSDLGLIIDVLLKLAMSEVQPEKSSVATDTQVPHLHQAMPFTMCRTSRWGKQLFTPDQVSKHLPWYR